MYYKSLFVYIVNRNDCKSNENLRITALVLNLMDSLSIKFNFYQTIHTMQQLKYNKIGFACIFASSNNQLCYCAFQFY